MPSPFGFAAGSDGCVLGSGAAGCCALGAAGAGTGAAGGGGSSCPCGAGLGFGFFFDCATAGIEAIERTTSAARTRGMQTSAVGQ